MAASEDDDRILKPTLMPLSQLATVRVVASLFNAFDLETLKRAFSEIKLGNKEDAVSKVTAPLSNDFDIKAPDKAFAETAGSNEGSKESQQAKYTRAKDYLLRIPPRLRKDVLEAVQNMHYFINKWSYEYSDIFKLMGGKGICHWRTNGTIDIIKMAQKLVLDQNINIRKRFEIACKYHLDKSVKILWAEMEAKDKIKCFKTADSASVRFWIRWLREGSRVPWAQAAGEYLELPPENSRKVVTRYSTFFSSLRPEDRRKFLFPLQCSLPRDLLLCFYSMTRAEQEIILWACPLTVLSHHLNWPQRNFFIETAQKIIPFIDGYRYRVLLDYILRLDSCREDFDYGDVFLELWNVSPDHLKESARKDRKLRRYIESYDHEMKRKGNVVHNECMNLEEKVNTVTNKKKKWARRNGRLQSSPLKS